MIKLNKNTKLLHFRNKVLILLWKKQEIDYLYYSILS